MNERLRILRLLEEGKINAEEAARLLEALSHSETRDRRRHRMWASIETIPEKIASAINHSFTTTFSHAASKEELHFSNKKTIAFRGISGDLEIIGEDRDDICVHKDGFAKIIEDNATLEIKALSGDIKIITPRTMEITIKGISGDLTINGIKGAIEIASVSGDIMGKDLSGVFRGDFVSGDVDLNYQHVEGIEIKTKSGDIVLRLDNAVQASLDIQSDYGTIDCAFDLKDEKKEAGRLQGVINKPHAKITIRNEHGDTEIVKR